MLLRIYLKIKNLSTLDDLSVLEAINIEGTLVDFDVFQRVSSDLAPGQLFLPPDTFKTQNYKDHLVQWSNDNRMVINQEKLNLWLFKGKSKLLEQDSTSMGQF